MSWYEETKKKIIAPENLSELVLRLREQKKSISTLNGAFDLLHPGHLFMISEAEKVADVLIMLLNSDCSIKAYKGNKRPYCSLDQRLLMVAGLKDVGYVSWFTESTPCDTLKIIRPDVHVNGMEYGPNCIEASVVHAYGGRIHLVERLGDFATTRMIKKLCE